MASKKVEKRAKIKRRIRKNVFGTSEQPRLSVFRSNKEIYAQIIDDVEGKTIASSSSFKNKAAAGKNNCLFVGGNHNNAAAVELLFRLNFALSFPPGSLRESS